MLTQIQILFAIMLILILGAVIAFCYLVLKPLQIHWARKQARVIIATGKIKNAWRFHNIYRILAKAGHDHEAKLLWDKLNDIKENSTR